LSREKSGNPDSKSKGKKGKRFPFVALAPWTLIKERLSLKWICTRDKQPPETFSCQFLSSSDSIIFLNFFRGWLGHRVTRFFAQMGVGLLWAVAWKWQKKATFMGENSTVKFMHQLWQNWVGLHFGRFLKNASGHPARPLQTGSPRFSVCGKYSLVWMITVFAAATWCRIPFQYEKCILPHLGAYRNQALNWSGSMNVCMYLHMLWKRFIHWLQSIITSCSYYMLSLNLQKWKNLFWNTKVKFLQQENDKS
jgi:hypothetical protein